MVTVSASRSAQEMKGGGRKSHCRLRGRTQHTSEREGGRDGGGASRGHERDGVVRAMLMLLLLLLYKHLVEMAVTI